MIKKILSKIASKPLNVVVALMFVIMIAQSVLIYMSIPDHKSTRHGYAYKQAFVATSSDSKDMERLSADGWKVVSARWARGQGKIWGYEFILEKTILIKRKPDDKSGDISLY